MVGEERAGDRERNREKDMQNVEEKGNTRAIYYDTNSNSVAISQEITKRKTRKKYI